MNQHDIEIFKKMLRDFKHFSANSLLVPLSCFLFAAVRCALLQSWAWARLAGPAPGAE